MVFKLKNIKIFVASKKKFSYGEIVYVILNYSLKFIGKHLCRNLFLNKVVTWRPATLLKHKLRHRCFI